MTTVGYGDLVPQSFGGKVTATFASICGIIVLAFPISMIVEKFAAAQESAALAQAELIEKDSTRRKSVSGFQRYLFFLMLLLGYL